MDKQNVMSALNSSVDKNFNITGNNYWVGDSTSSNGTNLTCYGYWQDYYYPYVIYPSYPIYIRERSLDKGKQAYEIIKILKDKKLVDIKTVKQFIELMDCLIQIL